MDPLMMDSYEGEIFSTTDNWIAKVLRMHVKGTEMQSTLDKAFI